MTARDVKGYALQLSGPRGLEFESRHSDQFHKKSGLVLDTQGLAVFHLGEKGLTNAPMDKESPLGFLPDSGEPKGLL